MNISPRQFLLPDLPGMIAEILAETGLPARNLALEITEAVLIDDTEKAVDTLNAIKALGVGLKIDDFGRGYSWLNYLHRFLLTPSKSISRS